MFKEDSVIVSSGHPTRRGLVIETSENDSNNSDAADGGDPVPTGFVKVSVLDRTAPFLARETDCTLVDRAMALGDIVRTRSEFAQSGFVVSVSIQASLEHCISSRVISGVDTARICYAHALEKGMLVTCDNWIGEITELSDAIAIWIPSSDSIVAPANADLIIPDDGIHEESHFALARYAPGQSVTSVSRIRGTPVAFVLAASAENFTNGTWLRGGYTRGCQSEKGLKIAGVKPLRAQVLWTVYNSLMNTENFQVAPPPENIDVSRLTVLSSCFEPSSFQLGDIVALKDEAAARQVLALDGHVTAETSPYLFTWRIIETKTVVSVQWQDASVSQNIAAVELIPCLHPDELEFWPSDYVKLVRSEETSRPAAFDRIGMVISMNFSERTAKVRWFDVEINELQGPEIEYSVYELEMHPDMQFRIADRVILTQPLHPTSSDWIGEVLGIQSTDGRVRVRFFGSGEIQAVPPKLLLSYQDEDDGDEDLSEYSDDLDDEMAMRDEAQFDSNSDSDSDMNSSSQASWETDDEFADEMVGTEDMPGLAESIDALKETHIASTARDIESTTAAWPLFKSCDTAPLNHHFYGDGEIKFSRAFHQRIRKEYCVLSSSLPQGILVRVYEDRMDLLRVLVVGPAGTPYEGALFLFDVGLPGEYPQTPPTVHFHSWVPSSGRINPNLYEDGKVCLSLLGTWDAGERSESWVPAKSSLLQVFVSIQSLVLTREPYFNEPGYEKQIGTSEGMLNSRLYNERLYLLVLKNVEYVVRNPPLGFEREVRYHFYALGWLRKIVEIANTIIAKTTLGDMENHGGAGSQDSSTFPLVTASAGCVKLIKARVACLSSLL
ncbi:hypothetical protein HDU78_010346 [Chytriomyces hyalinus]|nr:hypothetical protein HDU78_010346 [Chytriomyces hyalinus]